MSQSTGFLKNLYISQDLTLAEQIRLSGFAGGDKYKIIFPATQPTDALSVLGVNSISFDEITLQWLQPSESLPFDVLNVNQLNAYGKNGVAITATDDVIVTNGDIKVSEGSIETEYLKIRSYQNPEVTQLAVNPNQTESIITYLLPPTRPSVNGQVLSSQTTGIMNWMTLPPPVPPQILSVYFYKEIVLNNELGSNSVMSELTGIDQTIFPPNLWVNGQTWEITISWFGHKITGTDASQLYVKLSIGDIGTFPDNGVFLSKKDAKYIMFGNNTPINERGFQLTSWFIPNNGEIYFLLNPSLTNLGNNAIYAEKLTLFIRPIGLRVT
jgi:hypothetical protein